MPRRYTTKNLTVWKDSRGHIELDALARIYLDDAEITDRDRIAFALRELRKRGYDVEACPVDWTRPLVICSLDDSLWTAFGAPKTFRRLERIAERAEIGDDFEPLFSELYPGGRHDVNDFLEEPYEFSFKGDPALVESVFQAVGFATQHGLVIASDGSEGHRFITVAPPTMVIN